MVFERRFSQVFKASEFVKLTNEDLSPDFFQLSAEELKKEQAAKTLEAERVRNCFV